MKAPRAKNTTWANVNSSEGVLLNIQYNEGFYRYRNKAVQNPSTLTRESRGKDTISII